MYLQRQRSLVLSSGPPVLITETFHYRCGIAETQLSSKSNIKQLVVSIPNEIPPPPTRDTNLLRLSA